MVKIAIQLYSYDSKMREAKGLSQEKLARLANITNNAMIKIAGRNIKILFSTPEENRESPWRFSRGLNKLKLIP